MRCNQWFLVATAAALLLLGGCARREATASAGGGVSPVTIGYSRLRISLPLFVAQERGIFQRHGIRATLTAYDTAQPMMQALVEGRVSVAGYTALPITFGGMLRSRTPLLFVTANVEDQGHRISYLLRRRPDAGQTSPIRTIADLRGRRIGILPTSAYRAWLEAILDANGVRASEVTVQPIEPMLEASALQSGGVDALFTNDPAATAAIARGIAEPVTDFVEVPRYLGEPFLFGSFNVRKDWADAHPQAYQRLAAALDEAVAYVNTHQDEARRDLARYLPEAFRAHVSRYPDARYLPTSEVREDDFARAAAEYHRRGIIPQPIDLAGLVRTRAAGR